MRNYQHLSEKGDEKDDFASLGTVNVITRNSASDRFPIRYGLRASDFSFVSIQGTVSVISDGVTLNCRLINSFY